MQIDWANKPDWAEVWLEDAESELFSGWQKSGLNNHEHVWEDEKGRYRYKENEHPANYTIHYPPATDGTVEWDGKGLPPVGVEVEVFFQGIWVGATTIGIFVKYMVCAPNGGGFFGFKEDEIRPARNKRQYWINIVAGLTPAQLYDSLASGELEPPKAE